MLSRPMTKGGAPPARRTTAGARTKYIAPLQMHGEKSGAVVEECFGSVVAALVGKVRRRAGRWEPTGA
jgi:hypothetical protein